jgi:hypothetical protein
MFEIKEFKNSPKAEKIEAESFSSGIKRVVKAAISKQTAGFSFTVQVPTVDNVKLALLGDTTEIDQASGSLAAVDMTVAEIGKWHEILDADDESVYNLNTFSITDDATPPVALTEHEDYDVDLKHGMIVFYDDGPLTIAADDVVKITATIPEDTIYEIEGGTSPVMKRHIKFMGDPAEGIITQVVGWALLVPSGDLPEVGDEWQGFAFEGTWMAHSLYGKLGFKRRDLGQVV